MINKSRLIKLTQRLIRINSQNPPGDEYRIARFIKHYLTNIGVKTKIYEFKKRRSNVVAILGRSNQNRSLLISPHLDTVPSGANWHFKPLSGIIYKGKIYGLGATDCKGNLASALEVINSLVEDKIILEYNLIFAATCDEETSSSLGLIPLLDRGILRPTQAVILDSDDFNIIVSQKGLIHLKVKLLGKRAHAAYPWRGINAIDTALDIIKELKAKKFVYPKHKYLKPPTLNIGTIKGGDKVNIVADWCEFELDFRFLPGMKESKILKEIKRVIKKHSKKFKIEIEAIQKPYGMDREHPLVKNLYRAIKRVKAKPFIKGSEGATAVTFFQNKNIPAIATGFGSRGCAHSIDEYVNIDNLYKGTLALEDFLKKYKF